MTTLITLQQRYHTARQRTLRKSQYLKEQYKSALLHIQLRMFAMKKLSKQLSLQIQVGKYMLETYR